MNELLNSCLSFLDLGWYIFPCREKPGNPYKNKDGKIKIPKEKSPYTTCGLKDASNDKNQVKEWWHKYPDACIGISCEHSNLFLIDIDIKNGRKGIDNFMQMGISDEGALHSRTPSKGLHILFSGKGKTSTNIILGIDTRGDGGYFIAPPSKILYGNTIGNYIFLDAWDKIPIEISSYATEQLNAQNDRKIKKAQRTYNDNISSEKNLVRIKEALENLPSYMVDNYSDWIEIGMSLFELGEEGLALWDNWSKKSEKYESGVCEEKWSTFKPDEITVASLFYFSKENNL